MFESRDGGATWSLPQHARGADGSRRVERPIKQPPGHLGLPAILPHPDQPSRFWASCRARAPSRRPTTARRGRRATGGCAPTGRARTGGRLLRPQAGPVAASTRPAVPAEPRRHAPQRRRRAARWTEITEGLPTEFGFAAAAHPHDRDTFYVVPLDPGHGRCMPDGRAAVWRTRDAGSSWQRLDAGCRSTTRTSASCARAWRSTRSTSRPLFGTSTGQVFASAERARAGARSRATCPRSRRRGRGASPSHGRRAPADDAAVAVRRACRDASRSRRRRWAKRSSASTSAGPACATGSASRALRSGRTSTSTSTASARSSTPRSGGLAGRRDRRDQRRLTRRAGRRLRWPTRCGAARCRSGSSAVKTATRICPPAGFEPALPP